MGPAGAPGWLPEAGFRGGKEALLPHLLPQGLYSERVDYGRREEPPDGVGLLVKLAPQPSPPGDKRKVRTGLGGRIWQLPPPPKQLQSKAPSLVGRAASCYAL